MKGTAKTRSKPFICDVPAKMLKRSTQLSRDARSLYGTMRALANGKTGELAIRGNPLDWRFICKQAEIGRQTWLKARRELIAAGYMTVERERVYNYTGGSKRTVLGRARYFVHRQPKTIKTPLFLLESDSCTVQQSDPQILSETPSSARLGFDGFDFQVSGLEDPRAQSSSPTQNPKGDDDSRVPFSDSRANPFLTEEDSHIIRAVRKNLADAYSPLYGALQLESLPDEWFAVAMSFIESRGCAKIGSPVAFFTRAFVNFFSNIASGVRVEDDELLLKCVNEAVKRKAELREKYMANFSGQLCEESERQRRTFNAKLMPGRRP
jgi:hypothetical protein